MDSTFEQEIPHPGIYRTLARVFMEHNSEKDFSTCSVEKRLTKSRAQRFTVFREQSVNYILT